MSPAEHSNRVLSRLDGKPHPVPAASVAEMVLRHARHAPESVAIRAAAGDVTFAELERRARLVAAALREAGVEPGAHVALWAERTPDVLCAALGAWLAGAAYVPIDPTYPPKRVRTILELADPAALVVDRQGSAKPPPDGARTLDVAEALHADGRSPAAPPSEAPPLPEPGDAAYIIFTSGSTGTPKGVVVAHASLANYATWCGAIVAGSGDGAPLFGSMGFDHTITSWWVPLGHGRTVHLIAGTWEQNALFGPRADRYSFVKVTPSHARLFEQISQPRYDQVTECLMFGGEMLRAELVDQLSDRLGDVRLVNHYGPTEATVGCCWNEFAISDLDGGLGVPIGRPIFNSRAYVVDGDLRGVGAGEPGELVIAGASVATGYLHGDDRERFVPEREVEGGEEEGLAYRTGDRVVLGDDGKLSFLGRDDDQLNVGGYRIEREELRRHALAVPGVAEASFTVVAGAVDVVHATVAAEPGADPDELAAEVRRALRTAVPGPVAPKSVDVVDDLAVNAHGKLDLGGAGRA